MIFSRLTSTPAPSSGEDEIPTRHKNLPRTKEATRRADRHITGSTLGGPGLLAGRRTPRPTKAKKKKQTSLIRRGYLLAPLSGDRACRPSVPNLYMAAKTKSKLFEGSSLRLFDRRLGPIFREVRYSRLK